MFYTRIKHLLFILIAVVLMAIICQATATEDKKQDAKCLLPMEPGPCRMKLSRFYYNPKTDSCEEFKFGGCMGNDNKFGFKQTCEAACKKSVTPTTTATTVSKASLPATTEKNSLGPKQLKSDTLKTLAIDSSGSSTTTTTTSLPEVTRTTAKSKLTGTTPRGRMTTTQKIK